jgi:fructokinase
MKTPKLYVEGTKAKKILCIGEILWDVLPDGAKAGGAPMNVALHLKNFGMDVMFAGRIGNDKLGYNLKNFIQSQGLDTTLLQVDNELATSTVEVHLGADNHVKFDIVDNVAWDRIELTKDLEKTACEADVIIYGTLASRRSFTRNTIINTLSRSKALKLIDVNLRSPYYNKGVVEKLLVKASIVKLNNEEINVIGGWYNQKSDDYELTRWFSEKFQSDIVCVTRGDKGALIFHEGEFIEHPGFQVSVRDTVGSGDAFLAGFLSKYLNGNTLHKSLEFACATGAVVATKAGATPVYGLAEILDLIG